MIGFEKIKGYDPSIDTQEFLKNNPELFVEIGNRVNLETQGIPWNEIADAKKRLLKKYAQEAYEASPEQYGMEAHQPSLKDKMQEDSDFGRQSAIDLGSQLFGANTEFSYTERPK